MGFYFPARERNLRLEAIVHKQALLVKALQLACASFASPCVGKFLAIYLKLKLRVMEHQFNADREIRRWELRKEEVLRAGEGGCRTKLEDLGLQSTQLTSIRRRIADSPSEVVIAEVDWDGYLVSRYGPIKNAPTISQDEAVPRTRSLLDVVAVNGYVGVKKSYRGAKGPFIRELKAIHVLGLGGCNVPAIMDVDFDRLTITFSYILGINIRLESIKQGAAVRFRDINENPDYIRLSPKLRLNWRIREGKRVLHQVVEEARIADLFIAVQRVHACGFVISDIKHGNVIVEQRSGKPYLIDFEYARDRASLGKHCFRILRDQDIEKFNLHFDSNYPTYFGLKT